MAAIGTCWEAGSWTDDVWAVDTWANAVSIPAEFRDLTGLYMVYVDGLRDAAAVPPTLESTTLVSNDEDIVVAAVGPWDDRNTLYARHVT